VRFKASDVVAAHAIRSSAAFGLLSIKAERAYRVHEYFEASLNAEMRQLISSGTSAVDDATLAQVIRGKLDSDGVTRENSDVVLAHFAGDVCSHDMTILQLDSKGRVGERLCHDAFHLKGFFFSQFVLLSGAYSEPNCAETSGLLQCMDADSGKEIIDFLRFRGPIVKRKVFPAVFLQNCRELLPWYQDCTHAHKMRRFDLAIEERETSPGQQTA